MWLLLAKPSRVQFKIVGLILVKFIYILQQVQCLLNKPRNINFKHRPRIFDLVQPTRKHCYFPIFYVTFESSLSIMFLNFVLNTFLHALAYHLLEKTFNWTHRPDNIKTLDLRNKWFTWKNKVASRFNTSFFDNAERTICLWSASESPSFISKTQVKTIKPLS